MSASKWKPYQEYEQARFDWLGKIPSHWKTGPLKMTLRLSTEKNGTTPVGEMLSVSGFRGIETKIYDHEDQKRTDQDLEDYRVVRKGQLVVNTMWLNHSGLGVSDLEGHVSPAYRSYNVDGQYHGKFLHHLVRSSTYVGHYCSLLYGIRPNSYQVKNHDWDRVELLIPPIREQQEIAKILDTFTKKIDAQIHGLEKQSALLEEKRSTLIMQAVTKGLESNVEMKDSGINWIGKIPNRWIVGKIKHFCRNLNYKRLPLSGEERSYRQGKYDYYGASGVIDHIDDYLFDEPTVLIAEDGANLVLRNLPLAIFAEGKYWVNNHAHILKPNDGAYQYWCELLESQDFNPSVTGSAQPKLTADAIMNYIVAIPNDINERFEIQDYLISTNKIYVPLMDKIREKIILLQEYKTALISAAVTGKIDVRGQA